MMKIDVIACCVTVPVSAVFPCTTAGGATSWIWNDAPGGTIRQTDETGGRMAWILDEGFWGID